MSNIKVIKISEKKPHVLSVEFAESVLHLFEKKHTQDDRPRKAVEAKKMWLEGKISKKELDVAVNAAYAAACAASYSSYVDSDNSYAAYAAYAVHAIVTEREKHVQIFLKVLG